MHKQIILFSKYVEYFISRMEFQIFIGEKTIFFAFDCVVNTF